MAGVGFHPTPVSHPTSATTTAAQQAQHAEAEQAGIGAAGVAATAAEATAAEADVGGLAFAFAFALGRGGAADAVGADLAASARIGEIGPLLGPGPAERPTHPHGEVH